MRFVFFPSGWLSAKFDQLQEGASTRWGKAIWAGVFGSAAGLVAARLYPEAGSMLVLGAVGAILGAVAGLGLTFVDDRANADETVRAKGGKPNLVKTSAIYALYCLIGLIVVFVSCFVLVEVLMRKR